jgi:bacteriocin-like protein
MKTQNQTQQFAELHEDELDTVIGGLDWGPIAEPLGEFIGVVVCAGATVEAGPVAAAVAGHLGSKVGGSMGHDAGRVASSFHNKKGEWYSWL